MSDSNNEIMEKKSLDPEYKQLVFRFLDYLVSEKGLAWNTITSYRSDIECLLIFLQRNGISLLNMKRADFYAFLADCGENGLHNRSLARYSSAIKTFFKFLILEKIMEQNPLQDIESIKLEKKLPDYLQEKEINVFFNSIDHQTVLGKRDLALFELIYSCGLRVSEISDMKMSQLYLEENILRITGKGNKERLVPFGKRSKDYLLDYLYHSRPKLIKKPVDYVFLNFRGNRYSRKGIWKNLKSYMAKLFSGKNINVHTLRHTFATHMIQNGADLRSVQELLGHVDIATTQIYTHLEDKNLKKSYEKFHPHA